MRNFATTWVLTFKYHTIVLHCPDSAIKNTIGKVVIVIFKIVILLHFEKYNNTFFIVIFYCGVGAVEKNDILFYAPHLSHILYGLLKTAHKDSNKFIRSQGYYITQTQW